MRSILVGVPVHGDVRWAFSKSLALALRNMPKDAGLEMINSTNLCESRAKIVKRAVAEDYGHILWLDSDMTFPEDVAKRLEAHAVRVVGVNYSRKSPTGRPIAYKHDMSGPLYTRESSKGIETVSVCGFGALLMETDVFRSIQKPYFVFAPIEGEPDKTAGEDVYMCLKFQKAGIPIYIDHDTSKLCSHVGEWNYTTEFSCSREMQR